ncbi:MAG: hypothetical protein A2W30_07690 [Ignavibacteria bacterium RBG_16_36_9]|nr:MAG: hypothetical protein A2W30_07690 [Ignavibacteria bacterium RBG_16_36_9]
MLIVLLLLSAFFSGSEVAFFSIKKKNLEDEFKSSKLIYRYASNLIAFHNQIKLKKKLQTKDFKKLN